MERGLVAIANPDVEETIGEWLRAVKSIDRSVGEAWPVQLANPHESISIALIRKSAP